MRHEILLSAAISCLMLSACEKADEATTADVTESDAGYTIPETGFETVDFSTWAGKWTGPEGLYVIITPGENLKIRLEMQSDLDTKASYEGIGSSDAISFERAGEMLMLRKATGDETGLKYLAGKKDCLMVKRGEGYCRD